MRTSLLHWPRAALVAIALVHFLARPAAAFEFTYSPSNTQPGTVYFNGTAIQLADRFQLTPYQGSSLGSMVLDNLPKTPIKAFTVRFGLQMTNTSSDSVMADGFSFNFGPGITTDSVASEKGTTNGLAVAFDTFDNNGTDPDWVPGISIRWNGADLATTNILKKFNDLKTTTNFYDVIITLQAPQSPGGLSIVTVQYQGVVLSAQVQYSPAPGDTWRMMFAARTGAHWSQHAIDQIQVSGTAAELRVISPYGRGQTAPQAGTYNPAAFDYTYDPANTKAGTLIFNGSAANRTNLFLLTPSTNAAVTHVGAIVLNNLPQVPITEFTARIGLRMTNLTGALADGVSFNYGPNLPTNALPDETGITNGLSVVFNTFPDDADPSWVPGIAILWNQSNTVARTPANPSTNLFTGSQSDSRFYDAVITLQPLANSGGLSTVTVQYQGTTLSGNVPYAPQTNEVWRMVIGARTRNVTVTAHGDNPPNETKAKAFDGITSISTNKWLDFATVISNGTLATPSWIQVNLPAGGTKVVRSYAITSAGDAPERDPAEWVLYGVDASGGLVPLDGQSHLPLWTSPWGTSRNQTKTFAINNNQAFSSYRLQINRVSNTTTNANSVQLAELQLFDAGGTNIALLAGGVSTTTEQSISRIQLSGTSLQPAPTPDPVGQLLTPTPGFHEVTEMSAVVFRAPQYVYLDRYGRELDPTPDNINSIAHYRARLDTPAATVTPSGGVAPYSIANGDTVVVDRNTTVTWHWVLDNLAEVDSGTSGVTNLSATDITDAAHADTLGRRYLSPGTTGFDSLVYRSVTASQQGNVQFGSRGYVMENAPNSPERYLELAGEGDHLRTAAAAPVLPAGATSYTVEFWARRNVTAGTGDQVVLCLGSMNGAGQRLLAGFGGDRSFFISDGATRVTALPGWTDEEWHHWAAVCRGNGASNSVALYRDGVLVQQTSDVLAPFGGDGTVTIGARAVGGYATAFFSGGVNNVRIWDGTLARTNLYVALASKQSPPLDNTLLLEMPFDTLPTNSAAGVHVAHLTGAESTDLAEVISTFAVHDASQTNNFSVPSTGAVPLGATNAWHHRSRFVAASGGNYTFSLQASGPAQFRVDGQVLINRRDTNSPPSASINLTPGSHVIDTWMLDGTAPRSLSLKYSPDIQLTPLAAIPNSSLFLAASDLLALGRVTTTSTEGKGLVFVARGFEGLFPANTAAPTMLAAILPGFRLGLTALEGGQNTVQIDPIGKAPLNDWRRVFWGWNKEFQFKVDVLCLEEAGLAAISKLPYFAGEVSEANVDGSTSTTAGTVVEGSVNVLNLWLKEGERLTVGTLYRTLDRRYTLSGISANLNAFGEINLDKLIDGSRANGVSREYLFPGVFGPGALKFTYDRTIHRVNIPIGQGFDVSSLAAVNAVLYPELPEGATNLVVNLDGPSANDTSADTGGPIPGGEGQGWMWDFVGKKWHPTKPGQFTLSWPDLAGYTNTIEVHAGFPGDTETRSGFVGFENKDGTRQGSPTNRNVYSYTYPAITNTFPGAPRVHYLHNLPLNGGPPIPAYLDPDPNDAWFFKEFSFSENSSASVDSTTKIFTDTRPTNRCVLVFTRRQNPSEIPTGDLSRESVVVRVIGLPGDPQSTPGTATVGSRLESSQDTAGFHSGVILTGSKNYNPALYNTNANVAAGQWGPIYPVNFYSNNGTTNDTGDDVGLPLNVAWLQRGQEAQVYSSNTVTYTNILWPNATNSTTPVVYISSQMGSEGVGPDVSTNNGPNYQEIFAPAKYANLAIYNQPDRNAIGYNPNEEHALIAPSKAYVLTGDPRFNLGQNAAFALQNGLNNTNKASTNATYYTSDPFVLVQYSVPGATNASDAFAMKAYAVQTVRTNENAESFPALDPVTQTAFDPSGQPVPQPANPRYDFRYNAVAGNPVIAPYPLNLAIGNVVMTNTLGGNIGDTRALWQDRAGNRWAVSGNGKFFQRYWYPFRPDFWLGDPTPATGTPLPWLPAGVRQGDAGAFLNSTNLAVASIYDTGWGNNYPVLKKGETLTYAGGEYKADHPSSPGLPAVVNMASAEVVFDSKTENMTLSREVVSYTNEVWRYFRFNFTASVKDSPTDIDCAEIEFYNGSTKLTIAAASSPNQSDSAHVPNKLIDGDIGSFWRHTEGNLPVDVILDFGEPVYADSYVFYDNGSILYLPKSWKLYASRDNSEWFPVGEVGNATYSENNAYKDKQKDDGVYVGTISPNVTIGFIPYTDSSARVTRPLDRLATPIAQAAMPASLQPANPDKVQVSGSRWYFKDLPASLGKRFYYDSLAGELVFRGRLNDLESGAPNLTQQPVQPYVLEPNFLTDTNKALLLALPAGNDDATAWNTAVSNLQAAGSTEFTTGDDFGLGVVTSSSRPDLVGATIPFYDATDLTQSVSSGVGDVVPASSFGIGSALVATPQFLQNNSQAPAYLVLAENNDPRASGAVALHVIQLSQERYRGSIQVLTPQDPFSEKINLKHTGDFGGNTAEIYYQWWVRGVLPLDKAGTPDNFDPSGYEANLWQIYKEGLGLNSIDFEGSPVTTLADKFFFVRYGGKSELMAADSGNKVTADATAMVTTNSWRAVPPDDPAPDWFRTSNKVPFQWAGAANSPQLQADGSRRYLPQLVMGWVKRVLDQINLYEARYSATFSGDAPATYASMLQEAGGPYIGPVALNSDKNNLENVGLIALYETVLQRAKDLTQGTGADAGTDQAILLAATRLAFLYQLLGSEAFSDAQNSVVPQSADSPAALPFDAFAFKNEVANPLQEELALLRGTDFLKAYPAFNRLFWNYFKADGEAFYNATYNISDANHDGLINESDAALQYPMGHGDAWGHYLSATKMHYELLRRPGYGWLAQPEYYALLGNVLPVDYLDEKTFATIAADKVRTGSEIVKATYRDAYVSDPDGQWQGYEDTAQPARAWGVSEWSRRIGQGAWFDWMAVNAVTPVPGPITGTNAVEGLARIDRNTARTETASVAAGLAELQQNVDNVNRGLNPLGLDGDAMTFQADPYYNGINWERMPPFKQSLDKAIAAANNAVAAYEFASQADQQLRRLADDTDALKRQALLQDIDYKNRLIALYGTPYEGTIGPGQIFAEGYTGPDLLTYMYVDATSYDDIAPTSDYLISLSKLPDVITHAKHTDGLWESSAFTLGVFSPAAANNILNNFYISSSGSSGYAVNLLQPGQVDPNSNSVNEIYARLPYATTADYAFKALQPDWGRRAAPGEIQKALGTLLAAEIDLKLELGNQYASLNKVDMLAYQTIEKINTIRDSLQFNQGSAAAQRFADLALYWLQEDRIEEEKKKNQKVGQAEQKPGEVQYGSFIDFSAPAQVMVNEKSKIVYAIYKAKEIELTTWEKRWKGLKVFLDIQKELVGETFSAYNDFVDSLSALGQALADLWVPGQNPPLAAKVQALDMAANHVRSVIAEGERLVQERAALNQQIAAKAQRNRYADLVTRLNRNEAMRKYDMALDNALRYAWMAVKTYDYETSLSEGHPASAVHLLDAIVKTRSLGNWSGGQPRVGNGGLAEILGQLSANYDALQGQIGLNNGQGEANILSLRSEMMRISPEAASDGRWRDALGAALVSDLWQVPEFRQYCRPFATPAGGAQPGLVIRFSTEIATGKNFFGLPLSGLDHAFSPANYATKIKSFTAAFQNYDVDPPGTNSTGPALSISPRFYLVPAGADVQYCSDTESPTLRSWNVFSQRIPVPYVLNAQSLGNYSYQPTMDGRDGSFAERIRFGDSRAFISDYGLTGANDMTQSPLTPGWNSSSRLYGRSAWNTRWVLIIPGATLNADKQEGLKRFIHTVTDIKLYLETYSNQGM